MKKIKVYLIAIGVVVLLIFACKKQQQPEMIATSPNPCDCITETTAKFEMLESGNTDTDTIFHDRYVKFLANDSTANYTWYIGTEVFHTRQVVKFFDNTLIGQNIPITLVVNKIPNKTCYPNDNGYDSITKIIYVSQYPFIDNTQPLLDYGPIEATYRMKSENKIDSFDVVFYATFDLLGIQRFNIENYDGNGSNCINQAHLSEATYRQVWTNSGTSLAQCENLKGNIHNRLDGVTEMNFTIIKDINNVLTTFELHYLGRKL